MNKILIFLVWLLGLAAIAWLCNSMGAAGLPAAATTAPLAASAPAKAAAPTPPPASTVAPATAAPAVAVVATAPTPSPAVQAAASRIDEVLKNKVVEFRSRSATLTSTGLATLAEISPVLKDNPKLKFEAQGHTDSTGTEPVNLALSQARADAVKAYLVRQGVAPNRISAKGYGSSQPVADNTTAAGRARNRRMAFKIEESK